MEAPGHIYPSEYPGWVGEELVATYGRFQLRAPLERYGDRIVRKTQYQLYLVRDSGFRRLRSISDHRCSHTDILEAVRGILHARLDWLQQARAAQRRVVSKGAMQPPASPAVLKEYEEDVRLAEIEYREMLFAVAELEGIFVAETSHNP